MRAYIEELWEARDTLTYDSLKEPEIKKAILDGIDALDSGKIRVLHKDHLQWEVNVWVKQAIHLYLQVMDNFMINDGSNRYYDKVPLKFDGWDHMKFATSGIRVVPGSTVRKGAYISKGTTIMPSFIDIGVFIDENTFIDTYSYVGDCAYIGKRCHIGKGVCIGTSEHCLEKKPIIIEDDVYIGAKCEIEDGVTIGEGTILSMGCYIDQSTIIYDGVNNQKYFGQVPPYCVVKPGSIADEDGILKYACIIEKNTSKVERKKHSVHQILKG